MWFWSSLGASLDEGSVASGFVQETGALREDLCGGVKVGAEQARRWKPDLVYEAALHPPLQEGTVLMPVDPVTRQRCVRQTTQGKRCKFWSTRGSRLCRMHKEEIQIEAVAGQGQRSTMSKQVQRSATKFVLDLQARDALAKLGKEERVTDPKQVLMDTVRSAWRQRQVWEAMLQSVPADDWSSLGDIPIPGRPATSKGARIEIIQKFLGEATKTASRASKLAIDAGIEERLVRIAEEQSILIADTVRAGLIAGIGSLRLSPQAEAAALEAAVGSAATHLRALAAGDGEIIEGIAVRVLD